MSLKCSNPYCGYGPEWDRGLPVTRDDKGQVFKSNRADAYSQAGNFHSLCLNCLADEELENQYDI